MNSIPLGEFSKLLPSYFLGWEDAGASLDEKCEILLSPDEIRVSYYMPDYQQENKLFIQRVLPCQIDIGDTCWITVDFLAVSDFLEWIKEHRFKYKAECKVLIEESFLGKEWHLAIAVEGEKFIFKDYGSRLEFPLFGLRSGENSDYLYVDRLPDFWKVAVNAISVDPFLKPRDSLVGGVLVNYWKNSKEITYESIAQDSWARIAYKPEGVICDRSIVFWLSPALVRSMIEFLDMKKSSIEFFVSHGKIKIADEHGNEVSSFNEPMLQVTDLSEFEKIWKANRELTGSFTKPVNELLKQLEKYTGQKYIGLEAKEDLETSNDNNFVDNGKAVKFLRPFPPKDSVWVKVFEDGIEFSVKQEHLSSKLLLLKAVKGKKCESQVPILLGSEKNASQVLERHHQFANIFDRISIPIDCDEDVQFLLVSAFWHPNPSVFLSKFCRTSLAPKGDLDLFDQLLTLEAIATIPYPDIEVYHYHLLEEWQWSLPGLVNKRQREAKKMGLFNLREELKTYFHGHSRQILISPAIKEEFISDMYNLHGEDKVNLVWYLVSISQYVYRLGDRIAAHKNPENLYYQYRFFQYFWEEIPDEEFVCSENSHREELRVKGQEILADVDSALAEAKVVLSGSEGVASMLNVMLEAAADFFERQEVNEGEKLMGDRIDAVVQELKERLKKENLSLSDADISKLCEDVASKMKNSATLKS